MTARKKVIQGSTSSGKTHGVIPILIDRAAKTPRLKITVVAETIPAAKDGAVDIFKQIMFETNRWNEAGWIGSPMEYTFANGSRIQFKSFDSVGKAKASGKRDILFLNEGNHIDFEIADALMIRSKETYIDFNPDNEFWAHTEVLKEPNSEFLLLTYLDNEAIPPQTLEDMLIKRSKAYYDVNGDLNDEKNIKSEYWANWWRVYGLGMIGKLQGAIFGNWSIGEFDESIPFGFGLDFGFNPDPDAMVKCAVDKGRKRIYLHECIYATDQGTDVLKAEISKYCTKTDLIIADSSGNRLISDLKNDFNVRGVLKAPGSVSQYLKLMQDYEIIVTSTSLNLISELNSYLWNDKKAGIPIDENNHLIDAARYYFMAQFQNKPRAIFLNNG